MSYVPIPVETSDSMRLVKAVGVLGTAAVSGMMYSATFFTIPAILQAPGPAAAKQWSVMFHRGKAFMPPTAALLCSILGYASYRSYSEGRTSWKLFAGASALLPIGIVPFTLLVMGPTNNELLRRASDAAVAAAGPTTADLIKKWALLNTVRSAFLLTGASLGIWAILSEV